MFLTSKDNIKQAQVGAKAFNLWQLKRRGFRIPQTAFIPVGVYREFLALNNLLPAEKEFCTALENKTEPQPQQILSIAEKLGQGILDGNFPDKLKTDVDELVSRFDVPLAVRSSSLQEDSADYSFAGQFLTLLNIKPQAEEIIPAIKKVWASQWDETVVTYLRENKINFSQSAMGVIIQEMLDPQFSGVLFSKDPSMTENNLLIEYVEGLNEALVSGEKTPRQLHFNLANKKYREQKIPPFAKELVRQALELEKKIKQLVDIEWSIQHGEIYFLQFRPITTETQSILWTDENVGEVIPDIVTPYSWSILEPITNSAFAAFLKSIGLKNYPQEGLFGLYKGKVYFNNTAFNELMQEFYISGKIRVSKFPRLLLFLIKAGRLNFRLPARIKKLLALSAEELTKLDNFSAANRRDAQKEVQFIVGNHKKTMALHIACTIFAELYYQFLNKLCQRWFTAESMISADVLLTGQGQAESAKSGRALIAIAAQISERENIRQLFISNDFPQIEGLLEQKAEGRIILQEIENFIKEFGHGSLHEFELLYPRWHEDRSYIYTNLRNYLTGAGPRQWIEREKQAVKSGKEHLLRARKNLSIFKRLVFNWIFKRAAYLGTQRENLKQAFVKRHSFLKTILLRIGEEGCKLGLLKQPLDILYFTSQEIENWTKGAVLAENPLQLIAKRKEERNKNIAFSHPQKLRQKGKVWYSEISESTEEADSLKGIGCSAGLVEGTVRVIRSAEEFGKLQKGEILVTRSTNPGWTPLFILASAVVTEIGGALSHGAIIAREYGLPMVAAVPQVTKRLKDGQRVRVDGHNGVVLIIEY